MFVVICVRFLHLCTWVCFETISQYHFMLRWHEYGEMENKRGLNWINKTVFAINFGSCYSIHCSWRQQTSFSLISWTSGTCYKFICWRVPQLKQTLKNVEIPIFDDFFEMFRGYSMLFRWKINIQSIYTVFVQTKCIDLLMPFVLREKLQFCVIFCSSLTKTKMKKSFFRIDLHLRQWLKSIILFAQNWSDKKMSFFSLVSLFSGPFDPYTKNYSP